MLGNLAQAYFIMWRLRGRTLVGQVGLESLLRYPPDDHTCNMAMGINKLVGKGRPFRSPVLGGVGL